MIIILGTPRSGTTWLGKIFDSHPETIYRHEPDSFLAPDVPLLIPLAESERYRETLGGYIERWKNVRTPKVATKLPLFPKSYRGPVRHRIRWALAGVAKAGARVLGPLQVPDLFNASGHPELRWVWKSIESLGRMGALARARRDARFIHIIRHPCGVTASVLRGSSGAKFTSAVPVHEDWGVYELMAETEQARQRGLTLDAFRAMEPIERTSWQWVLINEKAMADTEGLENCRTLRYEDLCQDPLGVSRELFDFTGLGWSPQTERFLRESTDHEESSYYSVFKNPLHSAMKWKQEMTEEACAKVFAVTRDTPPGDLYPE